MGRKWNKIWKNDVKCGQNEIKCETNSIKCGKKWNKMLPKRIEKEISEGLIKQPNRVLCEIGRDNNCIFHVRMRRFCRIWIRSILYD